MTPEEYERLKEQEKAHLRQLRGLKQQHREVQRKKGLLDALGGLTNPAADATHDEMLDRLTRQNVEAEARFEVAMDAAGLNDEAAARAAQEAADREAARKAEAEALVRQMKSEIGASAVGPAGEPGEPRPAEGRTIGRVPPGEGEAQGHASGEVPREPKTIGRPRPSG